MMDLLKQLKYIHIDKRYKRTIGIILFLMLCYSQNFARLYLHDHLTFNSGYTMAFNTSFNDHLIHGFHCNVDYARSPTKVDRTYAFYYYFPLSYQYFQKEKHELNMGAGLRYLFTRTKLLNPYVGYELTFDQLYANKYYYGFRNKAMAGINIIKVDRPIIFIECSYHFSRLSGIPKKNNENIHALNISAGIRFIIERCDCPHF